MDTWALGFNLEPYRDHSLLKVPKLQVFCIGVGLGKAFKIFLDLPLAVLFAIEPDLICLVVTCAASALLVSVFHSLVWLPFEAISVLILDVHRRGLLSTAF